MPLHKGDLPKEIREQVEKKLHDRLESNAEYQRRNMMTRQERGKDAVDRLTKVTIESARREGREITESEARKHAEYHQNNYDRGKR
jgi:hypothetical protein